MKTPKTNVTNATSNAIPAKAPQKTVSPVPVIDKKPLSVAALKEPTTPRTKKNVQLVLKFVSPVRDLPQIVCSAAKRTMLEDLLQLVQLENNI